MTEYQVEVTETISRLVPVTAKTAEEAISLVTDLYNAETIVLDSEDYLDVNISLAQVI